MLPINQYITVRNRTVSNRTSIQYLVIHYVGAVSTAKNNCSYFYSTYRGASAHYFVDDNSIWQCVLDKDIAWHVGANTYYNGTRNSNSIGIEMCCYKNNGVLDMSNATINNTLELAAYICKKYNITIDRVVRHYDVTHKKCPAPFVDNGARWTDFKNRLNALLNGGEVVVPEDKKDNDTMNKTMYVIAKSGLNIRFGAGTNYDIVGGYPYGTAVVVKEMSNGWARTDRGWVSATYLSETNPNAVQTKTMYVTANAGLNVRTGSGTGYRVIKTLPKGTKVTVYEEKGNWGRIGDGQWCCTDYLSTTAPAAPVQTKTMYVNTSAGLNVRSGAGTNYAKVDALPNGTKVTVYEEKNGWARIGNGRWVSAQYLTSKAPTSNTKTVTASALNVRAGAGTNYKVLRVIYKGHKVNVYETKNGWSRIGNGEWVSSSYLK